MFLLLNQAIERSGNDDTHFFQSAYYFVFKKYTDVSGDILAWRVQQCIPPYVKSYLKHLYDL